MNPADVLVVLNVPVIIYLGIVTSYQDIKENKIKNKWITIGIFYAFFSLCVVAYLLWRLGSWFSDNYLMIYISNFFISLSIGIVLWLSNLWKPGDAKLFLMYSALLPLSFYIWGDIGVFPSYNLLINTFTPIFLYLLVRIILKLDKKVVLDEFKKALNPMLMLQMVVFIFGFSFFVVKFLELLTIPSNMVTNTVLLVFLMIFVKNTLKIKLMTVGLFFSAVRLILDFQSLLMLEFWIQMLQMILLFVVLRYFVINLGQRYFSKPVYIEDLKPGMCLAENMVLEKGKYKRKKEVSISFINSILSATEKNEVLDDFRCLSDKDVAKIKKLHSEDKIKGHIIYIHENIHFALFLFIGVILTIIFNGNILFSIRALLESFI